MFKRMTWLAVQTLSKQYYMLFCDTFWGIFRTLTSKAFYKFLQKSSIPDFWQGLEYASVVSLNRSATTYHSYRLVHSVSLGRIKISLAIAIAS